MSTTETQVDLLDLLLEARGPLDLSPDELHSFDSYFIGYISGARNETVSEAWGEALDASVRYIEDSRDAKAGA